MEALDSQLQGHDLDRSVLLEASLGSLQFLIEILSTLNDLLRLLNSLKCLALPWPGGRGEDE